MIRRPVATPSTEARSTPVALELYSDESGCNGSEYMAIAAISGRPPALAALRTALAAALARAKETEAKFEKLRGHAPKSRLAREFFRLAAEHATGADVRIDVLSWWMKDSRHQVRRRDDCENLQRMHYHLLSTVLRRWPGGACWTVRPDENTAMNWEHLGEVLSNTKHRRPKERAHLATQFRLPIHSRVEELLADIRSLDLQPVQPVRSDEEPLVQLADLFAGAARFAREKAPLVREWIVADEAAFGSAGEDLFGDAAEYVPKLSKSDQTRFEILRDFAAECRNPKHKRGVSLRSKGFFETPGGANRPIWFWHWEPQGKYDKAPTKDGQEGDSTA